jgi:uncharacterized membrane protein
MGVLRRALGPEPRPLAIVALGAIVLFVSAVLQAIAWSGCRPAPDDVTSAD